MNANNLEYVTDLFYIINSKRIMYYDTLNKHIKGCAVPISKEFDIKIRRNTKNSKLDIVENFTNVKIIFRTLQLVLRKLDSRNKTATFVSTHTRVVYNFVKLSSCQSILAIQREQNYTSNFLRETRVAIGNVHSLLRMFTHHRDKNCPDEECRHRSWARGSDSACSTASGGERNCSGCSARVPDGSACIFAVSPARPGHKEAQTMVANDKSPRSATRREN